MQVLYEDIVIRRMGQIPALAKTLREPRTGLRLNGFIKSIRVDSCPVWAACADVVKEDFAFILAQCPVLRVFSYHPHPHFPLFDSPPENDEHDGFFNPHWLYESPLQRDLAISNTAALQSVDISVRLTCDLALRLHRLLTSSVCLTSLVIDRAAADQHCWGEIVQAGAPRLVLPQLRWLQVSFSNNGVFEHYACALMDIPNLSHLTLTHCEQYPHRMLESFGSRLVYLHLYPPQVHTRLDWEPLSTIHDTCPHLEHLAIPACAGSSPTLLQTVKYLDVWTTDAILRPIAVYQTVLNTLEHQPDRIWRDYYELTADVAPALECMRLIIRDAHASEASLPVHWLTGSPDWPVVCDPRRTFECASDVAWHRFPDTWVGQTMWALFPTEQEICGSKGVPEKGWPFGYEYDIKEILAMMVKERSESPGSDDPVSGDEGDEDDVRLSGGDDDDAEDEDEGEGMDVDRRCAALAVNAYGSCRREPGR
ncbi:hypothetical protein C8Q76DRAFT_298700 [Earliella scabrosa]|nr:hypothetical protein C8Q76DRAFT_298700 [Earliella scabrosa]